MNWSIDMKKIYFLGDSITEGAGASSPNDTFVYKISELNPNYYTVNYGLGGTRIARQKSPTPNLPLFDRDFQLRAIDMGDDPDYLFVFGGTNDFGHGDAKLGNLDDNDPYTFCGGMNNLCSYLISRYGKEMICFILPLPRFNMYSVYGDAKKEPIGDLNTYIDLMKKILAKYDLSYLDLSSVYPRPEIAGDKGLSRDGLHPNDAGHLALAKAIIKYLDNHFKTK